MSTDPTENTPAENTPAENTQPYRRHAPGSDPREDVVDEQHGTSTSRLEDGSDVVLDGLASTSRLEDGTDVVLDGLAAGRHPVNTAHLVMGVAFLGLVAVWALVAGGVVDGGDTRWLLPVPWLVAGAAGIAATLVAARRPRPRG